MKKVVSALGTEILFCVAAFCLSAGCATRTEGLEYRRSAELTFDSKVGLDSLFVIGGTNDPLRRFGSLGSVHVTAGGDLSASDLVSSEIRTFSPAGEPRSAFGSRGRGVGQFLQITSFGLTEEGQVVVADQFNRRVSVTTSVGIDTLSFGDSGILWPRSIHGFSNGEFMLSYRGGANAREEERTMLFHLYDRELRYLYSFGETSVLAEGHFPDIFSHADLGLTHVVGDSVMFFAPTLFDGKISKFARRGGRWQLVETQRSREQMRAPYMELTHPSQASLPGAIRISGKNVARGILGWVTVGLTVHDRGVVHFSAVRVGNEWHYLREEFDSAGVSDHLEYIVDLSGEEIQFGLPILKVHSESTDGTLFVGDHRSHHLLAARLTALGT